MTNEWLEQSNVHHVAVISALKVNFGCGHTLSRLSTSGPVWHRHVLRTYILRTVPLDLDADVFDDVDDKEVDIDDNVPFSEFFWWKRGQSGMPRTCGTDPGAFKMRTLRSIHRWGAWKEFIYRAAGFGKKQKRDMKKKVSQFLLRLSWSRKTCQVRTEVLLDFKRSAWKSSVTLHRSTKNCRVCVQTHPRRKLPHCLHLMMLMESLRRPWSTWIFRQKKTRLSRRAKQYCWIQARKS